MAIGRVNRRGPMLPGFMNRMPSRLASAGLWEWPATTASMASARRSMAIVLTSWRT